MLAILAMLLAVFIPALVDARHTARSFVCMDHGRNVGVELYLFTDPYLATYQGDSDQYEDKYDALDFMESLYKVGEFWEDGDVTRVEYDHGHDVMTCPAAPAGLMRSSRSSANWKPAVFPREKVSYAMNRRLYRAPAYHNGKPVEVPVLVTTRVLDYPFRPLIFDVDAEAAMAAHGPGIAASMPFFCTPDFFLEDYWFPAARHRGKVNVAFAGGHVLSSKDPAAEREWDWELFPSIGEKNLPED